MHTITERLLSALRTGSPAAREDTTVPASLEEAETVQAEFVEALGGAGAWKVSPWSAGAAMGASPIPRAWMHRSGDRVEMKPGFRLEVEFALVRSEDGWQLAPAFELVDSRLVDAGVDWPELAKRADLLSTGGLVLGAPQVLPGDLTGEREIVLSLGDGTELRTKTTLALEPLLEAGKWLVTHAERRGLDLAAGTVVMTGARMGPMPLPLGPTKAEIEGLGAVAMRVEAA